MRLNDKDIRKSLIARVKTYKGCYVYEEITVPSGKARADIVAVNGHVSAYEIKSDYDSLKRLQSQVAEYDLNFERNYIVTGIKFSEKVKELVPDYWGIILVSGDTPKNLKIHFVRQAKLNPNVSFSNFLSILTSDQVKYLARETTIFSKKYSKKEIQKMFKQEVIAVFSDILSDTKKKDFKRIVRESMKGKNIAELI
ncbi:sce7726 family protein [Enterococcus larvae]|uniref:sce7726 family protein n=1 Tax=Enterococcus larvae TaxID=2794352 RepID=UPI003F3FB607